MRPCDHAEHRLALAARSGRRSARGRGAHDEGSSAETLLGRPTRPRPSTRRSALQETRDAPSRSCDQPLVALAENWSWTDDLHERARDALVDLIAAARRSSETRMLGPGSRTLLGRGRRGCSDTSRRRSSWRAQGRRGGRAVGAAALCGVTPRRSRASSARTWAASSRRRRHAARALDVASRDADRRTSSARRSAISSFRTVMPRRA